MKLWFCWTCFQKSITQFLQCFKNAAATWPNREGRIVQKIYIWLLHAFVEYTPVCTCPHWSKDLTALLLSTTVFVHVCTWLCGSVGKCCRTCSLGSKTSSLPPAIFLSGSNLAVSVRLSFALTTQWHLLQLLLRSAPSRRPTVHLSASHHAALNFCKQLTQPAPVLWPTGKEPI